LILLVSLAQGGAEAAQKRSRARLAKPPLGTTARAGFGKVRPLGRAVTGRVHFQSGSTPVVAADPARGEELRSRVGTRKAEAEAAERSLLEARARHQQASNSSLLAERQLWDVEHNPPSKWGFEQEVRFQRYEMGLALDEIGRLERILASATVPADKIEAGETQVEATTEAKAEDKHEKWETPPDAGWAPKAKEKAGKKGRKKASEQAEPAPKKPSRFAALKEMARGALVVWGGPSDPSPGLVVDLERIQGRIQRLREIVEERQGIIGRLGEEMGRTTAAWRSQVDGARAAFRSAEESKAEASSALKRAESSHADALSSVQQAEKELDDWVKAEKRRRSQEVRTTVVEASRVAMESIRRGNSSASRWGLRVFTTGKEGAKDASENRDVVSVNLDKGRIAVSDGYTVGNSAGEWAGLIAHGYTGLLSRVNPEMPALKDAPPKGATAQLIEWLTPLQEVWSRRLTTGFSHRAVELVGGGATLLGLEVKPGPKGTWSYQRHAAGDTNMFIVRKSGEVVAWPLTKVASFGLNLSALSFVLDSNKNVEWKVDAGTLHPGDQVFIMTDALAKWTIGQGRKALTTLARLPDQKAFEELVAKARAAKGDKNLYNDDSSLVHFVVPQAGK
jgi:hypothetical protein